MIVSHKHQFIFLRTKKTASTSIEIALSRYCGDDDILTPLPEKDEKLRRDMGIRGAQNYKIPLKQQAAADLFKAIYKGRLFEFHGHMSACMVRRYIDPQSFAGYYKFCFERNPWDKFISSYYWHYKDEEHPPPMLDFIKRKQAARYKSFHIYTDKTGVIVDKIYPYQQIGQAMEDIADKVGLPETPVLPNAKAGYRKDRRSYHALLNEQLRALVDDLYCDEIDMFGYQW